MILQRLFDLDLQLVADSVLCIIALFILFSFIACIIFIPILLIKFIKKKNDCDNCIYREQNKHTHH